MYCFLCQDECVIHFNVKCYASAVRINSTEIQCQSTVIAVFDRRIQSEEFTIKLIVSRNRNEVMMNHCI